MKKLIIIAFLSLIISKAFSQSFKAGINAGFANTDVLGIDPTDVDFNKIGFTFGGFVQLPISEKSAISFEMNFISKGSYIPPDTTGSYSIATTISEPSYRLRLNYIEVPVIYSHNLPFTIGKSSITHFDFEGGLAVGFLIYSDENINQGGPQPINTSYYPGYNHTDFSALIGLAYRITEDLKFHFRYENSFLAIRPHPSGVSGINPYGYYYNPGEVNMVFTYTLSYTF